MLNRNILMVAAACVPLVLTGCKTETTTPQPPIVKAALPAVAVPAQAGAVQGKTENSDAFIWELFTQFTAPASPGTAKPVEFETWASDADTFTSHPHWPTTKEPLHLHTSVLQLAKRGEATLVPHSISAAFIDVPCGGNPPTPPPGAGTGGFPTTGTPTPCIAEQVSRNRTNYDNIVNNNLNTQAGRAAAYKAGKDVEMEPNAMAIKGD